MAFSFALDFLGWKCLPSGTGWDITRFGNDCEEKSFEFSCAIMIIRGIDNLKQVAKGNW